MDTKNLSARFEPEFADKVQAFCERYGFSLKRCLRDALESYMEREDSVREIMDRARQRYAQGGLNLLSPEEFWADVEAKLRERERQ